MHKSYDTTMFKNCISMCLTVFVRSKLSLISTSMIIWMDIVNMLIVFICDCWVYE